MKKSVLLSRALAILLTLLSANVAASEYPDRAIRIISGRPAGSSNDIIARIIAEKLSKSLGQPVFVENKPGAEGLIAAIATVHAKPDGHTLLLIANSVFAISALRRNPPFDPTVDLTPIIGVTNYSLPLLLVPASPVAKKEGARWNLKTVRELVDYARAHPNELFYASGNVTGLMAGEQFKVLVRINAIRVPYKGEPEALSDLTAGRVQWMFVSPPSALGHVRGGALRALATTGKSRNPLFPEVPTFFESGVRELTKWVRTGSALVMFGPAKMSPTVVQLLSKEIGAILNDPETISKLRGLAFEPTGAVSEELKALIHEQMHDAKRVVEENNISKQD